MNPVEAAQQFVATMQDFKSTDEQIQQSGNKLASSINRANPDIINSVMQTLSYGLDIPYWHRSSTIAMFCGALIENGGNAEIIAPRLLSYAARALEIAPNFWNHLVESMNMSGITPENNEPVEYTGPDFGGDMAKMAAHIREQETTKHRQIESHYELEYDGTPIPDQLVESTIKIQPEAADCFFSLPELCLAAITCLSANTQARSKAREMRLAESCECLLGSCDNINFLHDISRVLDNEPLLVLHPVEKAGYLCRISGISRNFQLHTLLTDALIEQESHQNNFLSKILGNNGSNRRRPLERSLHGQRPSKEIVAINKGDGPQRYNVPSAGVWTMYQWYAIDKLGQLPQGFSNSEARIWNEGVPADIESFEGTRVLLLGPEVIKHSWATTRDFQLLRASVHVEQELSQQDVERWISRLAAAKRA